MIKTYIDDLVTKIATLDQIERFGGHCFIELTDGVEAGIKKTGTIDCYGNTYTPDERFASVGYVAIENAEMRPSSIIPKTNELSLTLVLKVFYNPAKFGDVVNYYQAGLKLMNDLNKEVDINGKRFAFSGTVSPILHKFEMMTIRHTVLLYVPCDYTFTPGVEIPC
jgi:hypothetical protein